MSGILDLLNSEMGKTIVNGVANETGQSESKTQSVLIMAMPVLLEAMKRNAATPEGGEGLLNALKTNHDGSILNDLGDLFAGGVNESVKQDGSKILEHILGNKTQNIEKALGAKAGIKASNVSNILKVAAPVLLGLLGKQTKQNKINNASDLISLIGGLLTNNSESQTQTFLHSILDADGDGSIIDDVAGMVLNKGNKQGGIAGMLGGIFRKR